MSDLDAAIDAVQPSPDDVVIVRISHDADVDTLHATAERLRRAFPSNQIIVLTEGADLSVMDADQLANIGLQRIP